jgi:hypothetical protein
MAAMGPLAASSTASRGSALCSRRAQASERAKSRFRPLVGHLQRHRELVFLAVAQKRLAARLAFAVSLPSRDAPPPAPIVPVSVSRNVLLSWPGVLYCTVRWTPVASGQRAGRVFLFMAGYRSRANLQPRSSASWQRAGLRRPKGQSRSDMGFPLLRPRRVGWIGCRFVPIALLAARSLSCEGICSPPGLESLIVRGVCEGR